MNQFLEVAADAPAKLAPSSSPNSTAPKNITYKVKLISSRNPIAAPKRLLVGRLRDHSPRCHSSPKRAGKARPRVRAIAGTWTRSTGTTNFATAYPCFGVSLGLLEDGTRSSASFTIPSAANSLLRWRGEGAYLGQKRIHVSAHRKNFPPAFCTGFPYRQGPSEPEQ